MISADEPPAFDIQDDEPQVVNLFDEKQDFKHGLGAPAAFDPLAIQPNDSVDDKKKKEILINFENKFNDSKLSWGSKILYATCHRATSDYWYNRVKDASPIPLWQAHMKRQNPRYNLIRVIFNCWNNFEAGKNDSAAIKAAVEERKQKMTAKDLSAMEEAAMSKGTRFKQAVEEFFDQASARLLTKLDLFLRIYKEAKSEGPMGALAAWDVPD